MIYDSKSWFGCCPRFPLIMLTTNFSLCSVPYCLCCRHSNSKHNRTSLMSSSLRLPPAIRCLPGWSFGPSLSLTPLPLRPPTASCSTGEGQWLTALSVLHAFLSPRCYTKKTWGQESQSPSLPRCRESNTIKRTLARYWKEVGGKMPFNSRSKLTIKPSSLPLLLTDLIFFLSFMFGPLLLHLMLWKTLI